LTKAQDQSIIVGEPTVRQAAGHRFDPLGPVQLAGRSEPVLIFTPAALSPRDTIPMRRPPSVVASPAEDRADAGAGIGM
jgi:class 3 adenylate cyclase